MMSRLIAVTLIGAASTASGQVLYSDNFDAGTSASSWTTMTAGVGTLSTANYAFNYSTVGIPSAPNSTGGSTTGVLLQANRPGGTAVFSGVSISPNGQSFTGSYRLQFDAWQNVPGSLPAGGAGSTQVTGGGLGTNGTAAQFPGTSIDGVLFGGTGDGGSANDYRAYTNVGAPIADGTSVYAATTTNNTNTYYTTNGFGPTAVPTAQTTLFPTTQTGSTAAGTLGMMWRTWTMEKNGNIVTWSVTNNSGVNVLLATVDTSVAGNELNGTNIFLSHFDINGTQTTAALDPLLFGLIDNVVVTAIPVPEPVLLGLVIPAWLIRRRLSR